MLDALRLQLRGGAHGELARRVVLSLLFAEMLAASAHAGPPHPSRRPLRDDRRQPGRRGRRDSLAGRRPRG